LSLATHAIRNCFEPMVAVTWKHTFEDFVLVMRDSGRRVLLTA
jgi:hypothetical protein